MRYLKQNTDSYITIGPALDKTAGFGNEDGLTVTSFAGVLVKEVQSSACTHTDFTPSATAANDWGMAAIGHGGAYQLKIPDSEINFVGSASLYIWYDAEALPMWCEFMVVPANVWDSLMGTDILDVSVTQIGGVAQSLTDLKDFVDTGYDPSTHKVAGVVLTDTCTTPTGVSDLHTDVGTALTNIADLHSDLVAATAFIDTEVADILADTNEIQAELADGGRIDLLVDSIVTATGAVEGTITLKQALSVILAACAGKADGGGTATIHFRNQADNKNRVTATVDADGNRTAITLDLT
jgi:hypothetical protein